MNNGKGSQPRNCFSKAFRDNYQEINWSKQEVAQKIHEECYHCGCRGILNVEGFCKVCEIDILGD